MIIAKYQLRRIIREAINESQTAGPPISGQLDPFVGDYGKPPENKTYKKPMTVDYVNNSLVNGKSVRSGESFGDIAMSAVMDGDWWKAANAIEDALWIDDPPVGAEEELADLLAAADPQNFRDLAIVGAEWGTRHFRS